jgi:hypothetical protein
LTTGKRPEPELTITILSARPPAAVRRASRPATFATRRLLRGPWIESESVAAQRHQVGRHDDVAVSEQRVGTRRDPDGCA